MNDSFRIKDVDDAQRRVIQMICPELHDVVVFRKGNIFIDVDFYFKDDPRKDEEGYTGNGLNEFIPGSITYEKLVTVIYILVYCNNLEFEEDES